MGEGQGRGLTQPPPAVHRGLLQQARGEVQGGGQAGLPEGHLQVAHLWLSLLRGEGTLWAASQRGGRWGEGAERTGTPPQDRGEQRRPPRLPWPGEESSGPVSAGCLGEVLSPGLGAGHTGTRPQPGGKQICKQARLSEGNLWELLSRWHGRAASTLPPGTELAGEVNSIPAGASLFCPRCTQLFLLWVPT